MSSTKRFHLLLLLVALLGAVILAFSTSRGPGVGGDAVIYLTSAAHLAQGKGLGLLGPQGEFRLLPYFPPFFPLVLSFFAVLGVDVTAAAHGLNILLMSAAAYLLGDLIYRTLKKELPALLAALALVISPVLIPVYSWAISEPLAIFLGFSGLALLLAYLQKPEAKWLLAASALLTGLSFLTRYSAAAFLAAWALLLLFASEDTFAKRLGRTLVYGLLGSLPMLIWLVIDIQNTAAVGSRSVLTAAAMLVRFENFWPLLEQALLFWLIPDSWISAPFYPALLNHVLMVVLVLILVVWTGWALRRIRREKAQTADQKAVFRLLSGLSWFIGVYLAVILLTYLTTYPPITIGIRMLAPVHTALLVLLAVLAGITADFYPQRAWLRSVLTLLLVGLVGWYGWRSMRIVQQNHDLGLGYYSQEWQNSELIKAVEALPPDTLIITNEETAVLYLTGRASYPIQEIYLDTRDQDPQPYGRGDLKNDEAQRLFAEKGAALVLFDSISGQLEGLYGSQTALRVQQLTDGLLLASKGRDGAIYYFDAP